MPLLVTASRIRAQPPRAKRIPAGQPFQPGEIFLIRYMAVPTLVTVIARLQDSLETELGVLSVEQFDDCVLVRMGRRARIIGLWLPWANCRPARAIHTDLGDASVGLDDAFWRRRQGG